MTDGGNSAARILPAVHAVKANVPDPDFERGLADHLREIYGHDGLLELYQRFIRGQAMFDALMRRVMWKALVKRVGTGLSVGDAVGFKHPETFEIGNGVFIGAQAYLQGQFNGRVIIGNHVWIGPQAYFDARDLVLEDYVGWGPGAKALCSVHAGTPIERPIIQTELHIRPVRVEAGQISARTRPLCQESQWGEALS